jgi:hypothetical protein
LMRTVTVVLQEGEIAKGGPGEFTHEKGCTGSKRATKKSTAH